jgi:AraC-like DNA-binding protein/mannose-6-phosphate isomerase-like protein (cupin superfamily)
MPYYITYGEFQQHLKDYYHHTGNRLTLNELSDYLYQKKLLKESYNLTSTTGKTKDLDCEVFEEVINSMILTLTPTRSKTLKAPESDIIPNTRDIFVIKHPNYLKPDPHTHNYFEISYVAQGYCHFTCKNTIRKMQEGEVCIIAPDSKHDLIPSDDSIVYTIMMRKSTFEATFFSLVGGKNLFSYFFRTILMEHTQTNFLMFYTTHKQHLTSIIQNLILECNRQDMYSNHCCISWLNLFFSSLLRNYNKTIQFYNYQMGTDFSLVLQYIQHNYQTLTLAALAELFQYSEPYLSTLISQNTGHTYTDLIKKLRLSDAVDYLTNTDSKIGEIADEIGYNSADHFSRVFRSEYDMSPQQYRKQHKNDSNFLPFSYSHK